MKIITFIIPSYNVERYLHTVLKSFITENEAVNTQIEVLVIDDGSSDSTADIARSYVVQYPDMFRLIQKENGGHGSTINVGSREAQGSFIKVIDADDWVVTENLPTYINFLQSTDADVVLTPFHMVDMTTKERIVQKMYITDYNCTYTPNELAADWKSFDRCTTFHGITYRTEFYNRNRHELPEKVFYEDQEYATIPLCCAQKVAVLNLMLYQYLVGNGEQSVAKRNQIKRIGHLETVIEHMLEYWKRNKSSSNFCAKYYLKKMEGVVFSYYVNMCVSNTQKREGRNRCKELNKKIESECPELTLILRRPYMLYMTFSMLGISDQDYEKMIHSRIFRIIRHNHKIEKE